MESNLLIAVDKIKEARLRAIEENATYALLSSQKVDIRQTKAYFYFQKYHKKRVFYYYLSRELGVYNGIGLRKYVEEVLQ